MKHITPRTLRRMTFAVALQEDPAENGQDFATGTIVAIHGDIEIRSKWISDIENGQRTAYELSLDHQCELFGAELVNGLGEALSTSERENVLTSVLERELVLIEAT